MKKIRVIIAFMDDKIKELKALIDVARKIVFFGGAGVSTESGIPDFRSVDGLYNQKWSDPPETILSASYFAAKPAEFYRFYREKLLVEGIQPNRAHRKLAELEKAGLFIGGTSPDRHLVEIVELHDRPFFVGCQFHPEFKSRPDRAHPLFRGLVDAALSNRQPED